MSLKSLNSGLGPRGFDANYSFQPLGWPWARIDGRDKFLGVRRSAIGDGSCFYHTIWSSVRRLSKLVGSPFLSDPAFTSTLDYLDVDYTSPDEVNEYVLKKDSSKITLVDQRIFLVDQFRNDLFRWMNSLAFNPENKEVYTEDEAIALINNDPEFMKRWMKEKLLNPVSIDFLGSKPESSNLIDRLLSIETGMEKKELYLSKPEFKVNTPVKETTVAYLTETTVDRNSDVEVDDPRLAFQASLFTSDSARELLDHQLYGPRRFLTTLGPILAEMGKFTVFNEITRTTLLKNKPAVTTIQIMKTHQPENTHASLYRMIAPNRLPPYWLSKRTKEYTQENIDAAVDSFMIDIYSDKTAEEVFISNMDWGVLSPIMKANVTSYDILSFIDESLNQHTSLQVKVVFEQYLSGDYLKLISRYINARNIIISDFTNRCGTNPENYTRKKYSLVYLNSTVLDGNSGWDLVSRSLNSETGDPFTPKEIATMKTTDPRKVLIGNYYTSSKWTKIREFEYERVPFEVSAKAVSIPINSNFYVQGRLLGETYETTYDSAAETIPIQTRLMMNGLYSVYRKDAGEDTIPFISSILNLNISAVRCYQDFVWLYQTWESRNGSLPANQLHILTGNQGGHYEVFGIVDPSGFQTLFPGNHPFIQDFQRLRPYLLEKGIITSSAEQIRQYLLSESKLHPSEGLYPLVPYPRKDLKITGYRKGQQPSTLPLVRIPSLPSLPQPPILKSVLSSPEPPPVALEEKEIDLEMPKLPSITFDEIVFPWEFPSEEDNRDEEIADLQANQEYLSFASSLSMNPNSPTTRLLYDESLRS